MRTVCPDRNNAVAFINREQFYSVNVQAVCDSKAVITNIVAPGRELLVTLALFTTAELLNNFAMDPSMVTADMHADPTS